MMQLQPQDSYKHGLFYVGFCWLAKAVTSKKHQTAVNFLLHLVSAVSINPQDFVAFLSTVDPITQFQRRNATCKMYMRKY